MTPLDGRDGRRLEGGGGALFSTSRNCTGARCRRLYSGAPGLSAGGEGLEVEPPTGTVKSRGKEGGPVYRVGSEAAERKEDRPPVGLAFVLPRSLVRRPWGRWRWQWRKHCCSLPSGLCRWSGFRPICAGRRPPSTSAAAGRVRTAACAGKRPERKCARAQQ